MHGLSLYLHEASVLDMERDRNMTRREVTRSKQEKFEILRGIAHRSADILLARFGPVRDDNDRCDVWLLDTLDLSIVDFLVTEDIGIHRRAERAQLRNRVFTAREALGWIQRTYEPKDIELRHIASRKVHQIATDDAIFESLREDYRGFDAWLARCRGEHRDCWVVEIEGELAGLVIRKDETHADARTRHPGPKVLKICTLKMKPEFQGERFGEQLLKKIFWFAQANRYDLIYLTVYPKHEFLMLLLQTFGFEVTQKREDGELVMERPMAHGTLETRVDRSDILAEDLRFYPRFYDIPAVRKYIVPIQADFHAILFPEIAEAAALPLLPWDRYLLPITGEGRRTPGNTIRKVYISRSPTRSLLPGDVLLFYLSKTANLDRSQCLTTIGVVEGTHLARSPEELLRLVGRRSVFSQTRLEGMQPTTKSPVLVIDFLLNGHFAPAVPLSTLIAGHVFKRRPPQSIYRLPESVYQSLQSSLQIAPE